MKLIEVNSVIKKYGEQQVLNGVSINIEKGKIYLIKGRSGCGKSTLLNICSFLENPDSGDVKFNGKSITSMIESEKKQILRESIGYIFQDFNLFEDFSVYENLYIYLVTTSEKNIPNISNLIEKKLEQLGLTHKSKDKAKFLSGGERQRLTLARTLLLPKEIIFADEPSANIDNQNVSIMVNIFSKLKESGTSLLIATHDDVFDNIADFSYELDGGILNEKV